MNPSKPSTGGYSEVLRQQRKNRTKQKMEIDREQLKELIREVLNELKEGF